MRAQTLDDRLDFEFLECDDFPRRNPRPLGIKKVHSDEFFYEVKREEVKS